MYEERGRRGGRLKKILIDYFKDLNDIYLRYLKE